MSSTSLVYNKVGTFKPNKPAFTMPLPQKKSHQNLIFLVIVFIGCMISVYDNVLNVVYSDQLVNNEENPIALHLIQQMGVHGFVALKAITTMLACVIGICVVYTRYRVALVFVLIIMSALFYYLSFYDSSEHKVNNLDQTPLTEAIEFYMD